jgi:hypothetical protein
VFYCDSDVLFLAPCRGLFSQLDSVSAVFMRDVQNAYSVRSWHLLREPRLRLAARVNTGIIHARRSLLDLDLLEWFFSRPEYHATPVWLEQTAWALLVGRRKWRQFDQRQIAIPRSSQTLRARETVALHFVGPKRSLLCAAMAAGEETETSEIRSSRGVACSAPILLVEEAWRRAVRLFRRR